VRSATTRCGLCSSLYRRQVLAARAAHDVYFGLSEVVVQLRTLAPGRICAAPAVVPALRWKCAIGIDHSAVGAHIRPDAQSHSHQCVVT